MSKVTPSPVVLREICVSLTYVPSFLKIWTRLWLRSHTYTWPSLANDGQVYVCDRNHNRVQIFKKDGTYVKETQISRKTTGDGVTFDIAFSRDPAQRLMYVADGADHRIWQLLREPLSVINHIGEGGRYPGQFYAIHNVSLDSK